MIGSLTMLIPKNVQMEDGDDDDDVNMEGAYNDGEGKGGKESTGTYYRAYNKTFLVLTYLI